MELAKIPVDILSQLSAFVDGFGLCKLWICGDRKLHSQMNFGVTCFHILYGHTEDDGVPHRWPSIIAQFPRLTSLRVSTPHPQHYHIVEGVDMSLIPSGIRKLELEFANSFVCLLKHAYSPSSSSKRSSRHTHDSQGHSFKQLGRLFPDLEQLKWVNALDFRYSPLALSAPLPSHLQALLFGRSTLLCLSHLLHLPPNLTQLSVALQPQIGKNAWRKVSKKAKRKLENSSIFPQLSELRIFDVTSRRIFRYLPKTLTRLELELTDNIQTPNASDEDVESSDEELEETFSDDNIRLREKDIKRLPSQLLHLSISLEQDQASLIQFLPAGLLSLRIPSDTLFNCQIIHLPRGLTALDEFGSYFEMLDLENEQVAFLPKTLTRLAPSLRFHVSTWGDLPPDLEDIGFLKASENIYYNLYQRTPAGLQPAFSRNESIDPALMAAAMSIPPKIRRMDAFGWYGEMFSVIPCSGLSILSLREIHYDAVTMRAISTGCPNLKELKMLGNANNRCCVLNDETFPMDHLEVFYASSCNSLTDFDLESRWARNLRSLTLRLTSSMAQAPATMTTSTPGLITHAQIMQWFVKLPSTLIALSFSLQPAYLAPDLLLHLPPSLLSLDIAPLSTVQQQHLTKLPRTLQSLSIQTAETVKFTVDQLLELMPPRLHTLMLPKFVLPVPNHEPKRHNEQEHGMSKHLLATVPLLHRLPLLRSAFEWYAVKAHAGVGWEHGETRIPKKTKFRPQALIEQDTEHW